MSSIFDRFRTELDQIGDRVKDAVESSKLHLERSSLVGQRSKAAYKLGMLYYRKERGAEIGQPELEALLAKLDEISAKIAEIDRQLDDLSGDTISVDEQPAPPATPVDAEVSGGEEPGGPERPGPA